MSTRTTKTRAQKARHPLLPGARGHGRDHRLSPHLRPEAVDLQIEVDPAVGPKFSGTVRHHLQLARQMPGIEVHADAIRVSKPRLEVNGRRLRGRIIPHPERETIEVVFDEALPKGKACLELSFRGRLRQDLRGFYASSSGKHRFAVTQLEATDARRFFPCFDEPAMKARFALCVTTGRRNAVVSNEKIAREVALPGGRRCVYFERTPKLSTYLLALAVGPLRASKPVRCGRTPIRIWHAPGREALTAFGLECARETLGRLERYFALPYPYSKLDLLAIPDFEAGAMENAGAVFFRETLLLCDPGTLSFSEKKRVAEVICHELAHMWYGDLVTMAWWDDLWLNEAFATWMAFEVVNEWKPEWRMWSDFRHFSASAYRLDALAETHPVYTPVANPDEATENFDAITYEKGAAVVRMIEKYIGPAAFRRGVRRYIRRHRESNAVAADLWRALREASGQDITKVVRAFIERPGFPLLQLERRGTKLAYRQQRFLAKGARRAAPWPIPFVGRVGTKSGTRRVRKLLDKRSGALQLGPGPLRFIYGNADESGFFRPAHEAAELEALAKNRRRLDAVERLGLLEHQWAIVQSGDAEIAGYLDLALNFADERDPDVLATLIGPLAFCAASVTRSLGAPAGAAFRARVAQAFASAFETMGWNARRGESDACGLRRAMLLALVGRVGEEPAVLRESARLLRRVLKDPDAVPPDLLGDVVDLGVRDGDAALHKRLLQARARAHTPQRARRLLLGLSCFRQPKLVERNLALLLEGVVETQDVAFMLVRLLDNPAAAETTWRFMKRRWKTLCRRLPPMLVTHPIEALPALATRAARRDVAAFFRKNPVATGRRTLLQALERFDKNLAFDRQRAAAFRRWLAQA